MPESSESFASAEAVGFSCERRPPHPEDDHVLTQTQSWLNGMPQGARPVHLQEDFPRIANEISRLWSVAAALDHYFEDLEFSPRPERTGFPAIIKEELLAIHLFSLRNRTRFARDPAAEQVSLLGTVGVLSSFRVVQARAGP